MIMFNKSLKYTHIIKHNEGSLFYLGLHYTTTPSKTCLSCCFLGTDCNPIIKEFALQLKTGPQHKVRDHQCIKSDYVYTEAR